MSAHRLGAQNLRRDRERERGRDRESGGERERGGERGNERERGRQGRGERGGERKREFELESFVLQGLLLGSVPQNLTTSPCERERERENSKTLFYNVCMLGSGRN